jgi:hypothetical protein
MSLGYDIDDPGFASQYGQEILFLPNTPRPTEAHSVSYSMAGGVPSFEVKSLGCALTTHPYLAPRLRMSAAVHPLLQQAYGCMAWTGTFIYFSVLRACEHDYFIFKTACK